MQDGFILTKHWVDTSTGIQLIFWIKTDRGAQRLQIDGQSSIFFVKQSEIPQTMATLQQLKGWYQRGIDLKTFQQEPVSAFYFRTHQVARHARKLLQQANLTPHESDIKPTDRFLMERFVTASLTFRANEITNKDHSLLPSHLISSFKPSNYRPQLSIASLDIETSYDGKDLYSIGVFAQGCHSAQGSGSDIEIVWMIRTAPLPTKTALKDEPTFIRWQNSEAELLESLIQWIQAADPDLIIGWNVVNFDFRFLEKKSQELRVPLAIGRNATMPNWIQSFQNASRYSIQIPGRVVLDGIDLLKSAAYQFDRYSLEFVSRSLLGEGKEIEASSNKGEKIKELFYKDQVALAQYNLQDCILVWKIFKQLDLVNFAVERSQLTGLDLSRSGGSVASFENLYFAKMHRKGYVAPNLHSNDLDIVAPGGYVLESRPGIYRNVLVFDFKSLYPSIIKTFKIDPVGMVNGLLEKTAQTDTVQGFNGAYFHRDESILPGLIQELWQARDRAKQEKNMALSQAIKIIMNSFYGVLGSQGCRFYDPRLSSSITMRGHWIIKTTQQWIEQEGLKKQIEAEVIYGDTDSLFVLINAKHGPDEALDIGQRLTTTLNQQWDNYLIKEFNLKSALELEFETLFTQFFMPAIRGTDIGSKKRYAGMKLIQTPQGFEEKLQFKGLETVRSDWTALAKEIQTELYLRVFSKKPYEEYLKNKVKQLYDGELDKQLIYKKRLRQRLHEYRKNIPPHAKAALFAQSMDQRDNLEAKETGSKHASLSSTDSKASKRTSEKTTYRSGSWVEYCITTAGPQPVAHLKSPINYQHYVDKQIAPVVDSILQFSESSNRCLADLLNPQEALF